MSRRVTLIRGDGIGPEVTGAAVEVLEAAGADLEWEEAIAGATAEEQIGDPLPPETVESIERTGLALKGPLATPSAEGYPSINVALRRRFDTYANVRPAKSFQGVPSRYENIDLVVIRENTEGMYAGEEQQISSDGEIARTVSKITRAASERVIRFAFEYAQSHGRKQLCLVHKANILKLTSGLFLRTGRRLARRFPDIEFVELIVDNTAMQLVKNPERFDVIVTTNLFGDILSDLCAGLVGGLGLAPAANIGDECAIFEAVHGTAPDIAGKGIANPTAVILSAALMLEHIGQADAAERVRTGVEAALADDAARTGDLGGSADTAIFTKRIIEAMG